MAFPVMYTVQLGPDQILCSTQHRDNSGGLVATSESDTESEQCCPSALVGVDVSSSGRNTTCLVV